MTTNPQSAFRDGTSQAGRIQPALDPDYIPVDERSIQDLLAFASKYASELRYFNEQNEPDGDWSNFLGDTDLSEVVEFINEPGRFLEDASKRDLLTRPHLILFVTFLKLLQHARQQLNGFTRRHLEFYYREALRLTSRRGVPDRVHTIVELVDGQEQYLIPAGTVFQAGKDLFYRSEEDLVANQAGVASLKSLHVEKRVIGIREARQTPDILIELFPQDKEIEEILKNLKPEDRSFMAMLMMALGASEGISDPGRKLNPYPDSRQVNVGLLAELDALLKLISSDLYMSLATFRTLMQLVAGLKLSQDAGAWINQQWSQINKILVLVGKGQKPPIRVIFSPRDNFEKNFLSALGRSEWGDFFNEVPDVDNIYDLHRRSKQKEVLNEVKSFIQEKIHLTVDDFNTMMGLVAEIHARWRQIYEILRAAGRKKDPSKEFSSPMIRDYHVNKFGFLIQKTLGTFQDKPLPALEAMFDDYYKRITVLENFFHMPSEKFVFIRTIHARQKDAQSWEWEQVYAVLEEAHKEKVLADLNWRKALQTIRETKGFDAMIRYALGDPNPGDDLPDAKKFLDLDPIEDKEYIQTKLFLAPGNFADIKNSHNLQPNDPNWVKVYTLLEQAQARKRKIPPAQIERWQNIYQAEDATLILSQSGADGESPSVRWRTFGEGYKPPVGKQARTKPGSVGFAIASPLLLLSQGSRVITLTLDLEKEGFDRAVIEDAKRDAFRVLLSTEKGMVPIENVAITTEEIPATGIDAEPTGQVIITITLSEQTPPITGITTGEGVISPLPQLHILLADIQDTADAPTVKRYSAFRSLTLKKIHLEVDVNRITDLILQNDDGALDAQKPFTPFGISPVAGSSFYFAHPELCSKKLDELRLTFDWLGAPSDFKAYYSGYLKSEQRDVDPNSVPDPGTSPIANNSSFQATIKLYDNRSYHDVRTVSLFSTSGSSNSIDEIHVPTSYTDYKFREAHPEAEVLNWDRYWQIELGLLDFQHSVYPRVAAACANKIKPSTKDNPNPTPQPYIVNPPYTPKIKKLSAGYTASVEIDATNADLAGSSQLYHIEPFGYRRLMEGARSHPFLPQFENEGELYIGVSGLKPPQNLSLLFQMAEGSADPDLEREAVQWSYLSGNEWHSLEAGNLLSDTTNSLLNSGIVKFSLDPMEPSTLLPEGMYWLRASIFKNSRSVADTVAIKAQAVSATYVEDGNAPDHLSQPLPAGSIHSMAEPQPEVKAIHQPFSSFGGKSPEQASAFYTRVSERLRHKDRALTAWDYEHMTLEAFPGIYKVKCLPVGSSDDPQRTDVIQVVVIPDIRGKLPSDPFEPKAPADLLWQIEKYLVKHSAPGIRLKVKNPTYIQIELRVNVRFREGFNPGYYKDTLNRDLQRYLSPWAYDQSADIFFGGSIKTSLIVNFVEERPYVDYVAGVEIFTIESDGRSARYTEPDSTGSGTAFAPDVILVSARSHHFDPIPEEAYEEQFFTGINYMKIELDFEVG